MDCQTDAIKSSIKNAYKSTRTADAYHLRLSSVIYRPDGCARGVVDDVIGWIERALEAMTDAKFNSFVNQLIGTPTVSCHPPMVAVKGWKDISAFAPMEVLSNSEGDFLLVATGPVALGTGLGTISWANYDAVVDNVVNLQQIPAIGSVIPLFATKALVAGDFVLMQSTTLPMGCSGASQYILHKGKALAIAHLSWPVSPMEVDERIALFLHGALIRDTRTIGWVFAAFSGLFSVYASLKLSIPLE